jgi:FkbM family methyltransferase
VNLDEWNDVVELKANAVIVSMLAHLPRGGVFVDVGANTGAVTKAAIEWREARVWAFEPVPQLASYCIKQNPTAHVKNVALGAAWDRLTLWCDTTENLGWNTFVAEKRTPGMIPVDVLVMDLDAYTEIPPIDVLKVDVEGYEWAVIRGGHRRIERDKPVIIIELGWGTDHPHRAEVVEEMEWLFSIGYERVDYDIQHTQDYVLVAA